jgi:hypothetical protein
MRTQLAVLVFAALVAATPASAEKYYKWQDANGTWHYGTKPPKDQQAEALTVRAKAASETEEEAAERLRKEKARNGVPVATAEQCAKLRENLKVLDTAVSVRADRDGDGEPEELSMEEQRAEAERTRKQIERFCD